MEVLVGPTFGMDAAKDKHARLFLNAEDGGAAVGSGPLTRALALNGKAPHPRAAEDSSETSSSIGAPDDSDEENDDDDDDNEAQSRFRGGSLASLESLEDSLPIKRGLSNHFSGKSKSFASLADVCTVSDLKKTENPLNKRRRLLIASKWSKKSFYSWANPKSMPLLALQEDDDDDDDAAADQHHDLGLSKEQEQDRHDHHGRDDDDDQARCLPKFNEKRRLRSFKTSFSLADLQGHSLLEDHDDDNN